MAPLEETRREIGLMRPDMLRLLAIEPSMLEEENPANLPKDVKLVARRLEKAHESYSKLVRDRLAREQQARESVRYDNEVYLTSSQVARATGLGAFNITRLRARGKLVYLRVPGHRYPVYAIEHVMDLLRPLDDETRDYQGPLTQAFLRYYLEGSI